MKRIFLLLALALSAFPHAAFAQTGARLNFRAIQTEAFPLITGYFDARDANGLPVSSLQAADVQVLEDGQPQPVQQLRSVEPGLRVIVVLTPGESFSIRNSQAQTRFDLVRQSMDAWAAALGSASDTLLSLLTPDGTLVQDDGAPEWLSALDSYQVPLGATQINAQGLEQALAMAAQPAAEPGAGTAIWWITSTPPAESLATAASWQTQLTEAGVALFIWQIDAPSTFDLEASQTLQSLAEATGGQRFTFSGPEAFPQPEDYFSPLRSAYFFQYSSQLRTDGEHTVLLQLQGETIVSSQSLTFPLDIQPPNPILVTPPAQIERGPSEDDSQLLSPFSQPIEIVIEFPDGFERNLVRSTLYANDQIVAENTTAPFNHFAWDLSLYTESQQVLLRVEVEDELGLVGTSTDAPVDFSVQAPPGWFQALLARGASTLAFSVVLIAAGAFFLVMVLSGRINPSRLNVNKIFRRDRLPVARPNDPLSDSPLGIEQEKPTLNPFAAEALPQDVPAFLQRLTVQDPNQSAFTQPLDGSELLIGSGPLCNLILADQSVDKQHARLTLDSRGEFHLADLGSQAGTWVNYAPVSLEGSRLQDGDIVHIGRVPFRFLLNSSQNTFAS